MSNTADIVELCVSIRPVMPMTFRNPTVPGPLKVTRLVDLEQLGRRRRERLDSCTQCDLCVTRLLIVARVRRDSFRGRAVMRRRWHKWLELSRVRDYKRRYKPHRLPYAHMAPVTWLLRHGMPRS